jgi:hypothetical protein
MQYTVATDLVDSKNCKKKIASRRDDSNMRYRLNFEFRTKNLDRRKSSGQGRMLPCGKIAYDHVAKSN